MLPPQSAIAAGDARPSRPGRSGCPSTVTWLRPRRRVAVLGRRPAATSTSMPRGVERPSRAPACDLGLRRRRAPEQHAEHQPAADDDLLDVDDRHVGAGQGVEQRRGHPGAVPPADGHQQGAACVVAHWRQTVTRWPLPMTTMPPSETVKRCAVALEVDADLGALRHDHVLVEDRVADDGVPADVDALHQHRALDLGPRVHRHVRARRPSSPPARRRSTAPGETIEPTARPTRSCQPCTNLAGGQRLGASV